MSLYTYKFDRFIAVLILPKKISTYYLYGVSQEWLYLPYTLLQYYNSNINIS